LATAGSKVGGPSHATFYVQADDVDAYLAKVQSLGGRTIQPPIDVVKRRRAVGASPDGG
jgi:predicted enzyme related to lactoylglutathione lyase